MSDARLIGRWSDDRLYLGATESSDLVFMADGVGWSVWANALGCEQLYFRWTATNGRLVIASKRYVRLEGSVDSLVVVDDEGRDETIDTGFVIRAGHDAGGTTAILLELDQRIGFGDRFARVRGDVRPEDDPAGWTLRDGFRS